MRRLLSLVLVLFAFSTVAQGRRAVAPAAVIPGGSTIWWLLPTQSAYEAQQTAQQVSMDNGAQNVATTTTTADYKYLVFARTGTGAMFAPEEHSYVWTQFADINAAVAEYNGHSSAKARGIISMYDGVHVVFWSKQQAQ
jgi:hypothetical protein